MANVLILAETGFGKSMSIGKVHEFNHKGLNPDETYIISVTSKDLPFRGSHTQYPVTTVDKLREGRRIITNDSAIVAQILTALSVVPHIKNIIIDDFNYLLQDYYMKNAMKQGWDVPKQIGANTYKVFEAMEIAGKANKNIFVFAHPEEYKKGNTGLISYRMKTTGKMTTDYITPEGKFLITLFGKSYFDETTKKVVKQFVTNEDDTYPAKSPIGMFKKQYIPNDLGYVLDRIEAYNRGEEMDVEEPVVEAEQKKD